MKTFLLCLLSFNVAGQTVTRTLLKADRVFDGESMHAGWSVLVNGKVIEAVGDLKSIPPGTKTIMLPGTTLMPGMIEGHSHLFLHPYNETSWDDQVLNESRAERIARAINHAKATLLAGFTTVRDLGTEGSMYDDASLKSVIEKGIVPGPRMIIATRAIVAKGTYGPRKGNADIDFPQGAAEVGSLTELINEVRVQIGKGADVVKIYADYRWGKNHEEAPTFTVEEIAAAVAVARSGGREVVAHAASPEGMRRAILGGVSVIEHGDHGTAEVFALMKEKDVALCPTISAGEAVATYRAEQKAGAVDSSSIREKMISMKFALTAGVTICMGGDVGVYTHGDNARELIAMKRYGMSSTSILQAATSVNAKVFGVGEKLGRLKTGMLADIIAVTGDPSVNIEATKQIRFVMKDGIVYKNAPGN